jgi:hypothetical protein
LYPNVVVPWKMTVVPELSLVRSRVVPDGTATLLRIMVAQEVLDLLAEAASVKVQLVPVARSFSCAAWVGAGATAGAADTRAPALRSSVESARTTILKRIESELREWKVLKE